MSLDCPCTAIQDPSCPCYTNQNNNDNKIIKYCHRYQLFTKIAYTIGIIKPLTDNKFLILLSDNDLTNVIKNRWIALGNHKCDHYLDLDLHKILKCLNRKRFNAILNYKNVHGKFLTTAVKIHQASVDQNDLVLKVSILTNEKGIQTLTPLPEKFYSINIYIENMEIKAALI